MLQRVHLIISFNVVILLVISGSLLFTSNPLSAATDEIYWTAMGGDTARYPLIGGIDEGQSIVLNNRMYVFSGYNPDLTPTRKSFIFDPAKINPWTAIADMPVGLTHMGVATDGTDIYMAGGYIENIPYNGDVPVPKSRIMGSEKFYRYNVADNTYTSLPNLPKKASAGQMAYVSGKLHYIGGTTPVTGAEDYEDHFVFDLEAYALNPDTTTWQDITNTAPLPNPRQHAASAVLDNQIYYISGEWGHGSNLVSQDDVHRYDPATNIWTEVEGLPGGGRNHIGSTTFVYNGRILVLGGQSASNVEHATVFAFDPNVGDPDNDGKPGVWTTLNPLPIEQFGGIGGIINGTFYFGTGVRAHDELNARRRMWKGVPGIAPTSSSTPTNTSIPPTSTPTYTPTNTPSQTPTHTNIPPTATLTGTSTDNTILLTNTGLPPSTTLASTEVPATNTPTTEPTSMPTASATPSTANNLLVNGSFEIDSEGNKQPDGWTLKFGSKDKQKCNKEEKPAVAFDQQCAYVFKGGGDGITPENAKLEQTVDLTTLTFQAGDSLELAFYINNAGAAVSGQIKLVVKYADTTPKSKIAPDLAITSGYEIRTETLALTSTSISKIKVQIKHTASSGKTLLDSVSLSKTSGSAALLPLP